MIFSRIPYKTVRRGWKVVKAELPAAIVSAIENSSDDPNHVHRSIHCINILYRKFLIKEMEIDDYFTISDAFKNYLFNGSRKYHPLLTTTIVQDLGILERVTLQSGQLWARGKASRYKFNPKFIVGQSLEVIYYEVRLSQLTKRHINKEGRTPQLRGSGYLEEKLSSILDRVTLVLNKTEIEDMVLSRKGEIRYKVLSRSAKGKNGAIHYFKKGKKKVIKKGLYNDLDHFVNEKVDQIIMAHIISLISFKNRDYRNLHPHRDRHSKRLFHDLLNIPSCYLKHFRLDGENLYEIDLCSSQFCLFANILIRTKSQQTPYALYDEITNSLLDSLKEESRQLTLKQTSTNNGNKHKSYLSSHFLGKSVSAKNQELRSTKGIEDWIQESTGSKFYEYIHSVVQPEVPMNPGSIKDVKGLMLSAGFGDFRYSKASIEKQKLWKGFQEVMTILNGIKSHLGLKLLTFEESKNRYGIDLRSIVTEKTEDPDKGGSNLFSISLQRIESHIFIDSLLQRVYSKRLLAIPKHDSFLVKESEMKLVYKIMFKKLLRILGTNDSKNPNFSLRIPKPV